MNAARSFTVQLAAIVLGALLVADDAHADPLKRLTFDDTIEVVPCDHFVAAEAFRAGRPIGGRTLGNVSFNFNAVFLSGVPADAEPQVSALEVWTLRYSGDDVSLIKDLGGEQRVALSLCAVYRLIEMAEQGGSLTDARSNFAFAHSPVDRRLWAIHWFVNHDDQWTIGAVEVPHPALDWPSGARVFSRAITSARDQRR